MGHDVQEFCLRWNNHHSTLISVLDSMLSRETLCDVLLAAEGQFIKVHRLVLFACSQYFEDLLTQQSEKQAVVFLKDVRFSDLQAIVEYMYRGEVNVTQDQLEGFLSTAEALKIKGLAYKNEQAKNTPTPPENVQSLNPVKQQLPMIEKTKTLVPHNPQEVKIVESSLGDHSDIAQSEASHKEDLEADMLHLNAIEMAQEDHFVAITHKVEAEDSHEGSYEIDQLDSGDHWSAKDMSEDWSNSQGEMINPDNPTPSTSSAADTGMDPWRGKSSNILTGTVHQRMKPTSSQKAATEDRFAPAQMGTTTPVDGPESEELKRMRRAKDAARMRFYRAKKRIEQMGPMDAETTLAMFDQIEAKRIRKEKGAELRRRGREALAKRLKEPLSEAEALEAQLLRRAKEAARKRAERYRKKLQAAAAEALKSSVPVVDPSSSQMSFIFPDAANQQPLPASLPSVSTNFQFHAGGVLHVRPDYQPQ